MRSGGAATTPAELARYEQADAATAEEALYDLPPLGRGAGHVSLLHMTDCHAQLKPVYFREPDVNIGIGTMAGTPPHLVGEALLRLRPRNLRLHLLQHGARLVGRQHDHPPAA